VREYRKIRPRLTECGDNSAEGRRRVSFAGLRSACAATRLRPTTLTGLPTEARDASEGWSGKRDSNPRLRPWQGRTLPLSYSRSRRNLSVTHGFRTRQPGRACRGVQSFPLKPEATVGRTPEATPPRTGRPGRPPLLTPDPRRDVGSARIGSSRCVAGSFFAGEPGRSVR
jgi:hypothetical protein